MTKTTLAALALALTAVTGIAPGTTSTAEAGYKFRSFSYGYHISPLHVVKPLHFVKHNYYVKPYHYAAPVIAYKKDCSHAFYAWKSTGSDHWKWKYFACKGW
jgi:hypothetical protein